MSMINVAIVGCGRMGRLRAKAAVAAGARISMVVDADRNRAMQLEASCEACAFADHPRDLPWNDLDAVFICTPPGSRGPVELECLSRGVAFFVEKPVGLSADHVSAISAALNASPVLTAVGYMNRHRPSVTQARAFIADRKVLGISCHWLCGAYRVPWWAQPDSSGGPLNEQATHFVDLCRYLVGEIDQVSATAATESHIPDLPTTIAATLNFSCGVPGTLFYSCNAIEKQIRFQVFTPEGTIELNGWDLQLIHAGEVIHAAPADRNQIFHDEVSAFLNAVSTGDPAGIRCTFADALRTQQVVDAMKLALTAGGSAQIGRSASLKAAQ